ncbi:MAG: sensor histidine kinase [Culicoidibacterales bacterium]
MIKQFARSRLAVRIFFITTLLITVTALTIHSLFSLFLPGFYYQYKEKQITESVQILVNKLDDTTFEHALQSIDTFALETGLQIALTDEQNQLIYVPNTMQYQSVGDGVQKFSISAQSFTATNDYLVVKYEFKPTNINTMIHLIVRSPLQPIDEASQAINNFLPYLLFIIVVVALIAALVLTRIIAKPLLRLNQASAQMAQLDFSADLPIEANDEIGDIARSLATLAHNLEQTMTQLQVANQKLQNDIEKERMLEQQRREFIATVSHELKTPLTAILGRLEGMIYNIGAFSDRDKYLQQTYDVAKQMEQLVYEIVSVSKLESEAFQPQQTDIYLSKVIHSCVAENSYLAHEKSQKIVLSIDEHIYCCSDEQLIRKVVINLLRNAIYYSPIEAEIYVTLHDEHLLIVNTGVCMTPEQITYVLQPFHRLEQSRNRQTGGSGLGLYIVTQIAKRCQLLFNIQSDCDKQSVQAEVIFPNVYKKM